nr:retrotransposon protein, putative, Ty3-gypsy subclass [Tanacetum cinerariifolium]
MKWYRNLRIVLSVEDKLLFLEQLIHAMPVPAEGQVLPLDVLNTHTVWVKASKKIASPMLMTMDLDNQKNLEHLGAYDMLKELKMFKGKTVIELHAMLKLHEQTLPPKEAAPALYAIRAGRIQKTKRRNHIRLLRGIKGKAKQRWAKHLCQCHLLLPNPRILQHPRRIIQQRMRSATNVVPYSPRYDVLRSYAPIPGCPYGLFMGGYPVSGYGLGQVSPRVLWGPLPMPLFPAYLNGGHGLMGMAANGYNRIVGARTKWDAESIRFDEEDIVIRDARIVKGKEVVDDDLRKPFKEAMKTPLTRRIIEFAHRPARGWFERLLANSIDKWADPREAFTYRYSVRKMCFKEPYEITKIIRRANESLTAFKERWTIETGFIMGVLEVMKISSFMDSLKFLKLAKLFSDKASTTLTEMMRRLDDFIRLEKDFAQTELPKGETGEQHQKLYFPSLEAALESDMLNQFDKGRAAKRKRESKGGWLLTGKDNQHEGISDEPLLVEAEVEGYLVRKIYVDGGELVEVMFEHCFKNLSQRIKARLKETQIDLVGFAREAAKPLGKIDLEVCFGRMGLKALRDIPSTIHTMMKFPTPRGTASWSPEAYVDDMVVKSDDEKMLPADVAETFDNLRRINMKLNLKKCSFGVEEVKFLGYMVTFKGIRANPKKTSVLADLHLPRTLKEIEVGIVTSAHDKETEASRKLTKYDVELRTYNITFEPRNAMKAQVLADFIFETSDDESPENYFRSPKQIPERDATEEWVFLWTGHQARRVPGQVLVLIGPSRIKHTDALLLTFDSTNNEAEYEALLTGLRITREIGIQNLAVKVDSKLVSSQINRNYVVSSANMMNKLTSMAFNHLTKEVLVEVLNERSTKRKEISMIVKEEGDNWMISVLGERRSCGIHCGPQAIVRKALRQGYYWPTMHEDAKKEIQRIRKVRMFQEQYPQNKVQQMRGARGRAYAIDGGI